MEDEIETKTETETPPPPTPEPHHEDSTLRETVDALKSSVDELRGMVTGLIEAGHAGRDSSPVKKPWTHRFDNR